MPLSTHDCSFRRLCRSACAFRIKVHKDIQLRLEILNPLQMNIHQLNRGNSLCSNVVDEFRNAREINWVHLTSSESKSRPTSGRTVKASDQQKRLTVLPTAHRILTS